MFAILRRWWVTLVVIIAVVFGATAVIRMRGEFGSDEIFSSTGRAAESIESINPKRVTYEVFGTAGATGSVSFLNAKAQPEQARFSRLPWTYTITTTIPTVIANVVAQGDGSDIGCRITVNGVVKDQQSSQGHAAQTFCLVKAA